MEVLGAPMAVGWEVGWFGEVIELKDRTGVAGFDSVVIGGADGAVGTTSTLSCSPARKEKGFFLVSVVVVVCEAGVTGVPIDPNDRVWVDGEVEVGAGVPIDPNERVWFAGAAAEAAGTPMDANGRVCFVEAADVGALLAVAAVGALAGDGLVGTASLVAAEAEVSLLRDHSR
jgi:hypothetical protein